MAFLRCSSREVFTHKIEMSYTGIRRLPNAMLSIELKIMLHFLKTYSVKERKTVKHVVGKNNFFEFTMLTR